MRRILLPLVLGLSLIFTGCKVSNNSNQTYRAFMYNTFDYAIIKLPNGEVVEGKIEKYTSTRSCVNVKIGGKVYSVAYNNCAFICNEP